MNRWVGKIAVVTGASSGIGLSITKELVNNGLIVVGLARRLDLLEDLQNQISYDNNVGKFYSYKCDVSSLDSIIEAFTWINEKFGRINILINNAGIVRYCGILTTGNEEEIKKLMEINFMGAIFCTKQMYDIMKDKEEECHIINMNSVLGHSTPFSIASMTYNLYPSSKFALKAATEVIRQELIEKKSFRISNISPGLVKTELCHAGNHPYADVIMGSAEILLPEDISRTIIFILESPQHVQISELIIMPVGQKF
ncbi:farnesol dehydrogenase-like [Condylostylus longicornis]|uniref:farnesol dehydrogenase-like n=1 Tax=Condylostylus longicornis TaxID=2530218 RepID=UPI00244E3B83|nr:farnesol dehydrogenase-like [Condylostylus longicornis]